MNEIDLLSQRTIDAIFVVVDLAGRLEPNLTPAERAAIIHLAKLAIHENKQEA